MGKKNHNKKETGQTINGVESKSNTANGNAGTHSGNGVGGNHPNLFETFNLLVENASKGEQKWVKWYLQYNDMFNEKDRTTIEQFKNNYLESGNNITVVDSLNDDERITVSRFLNFLFQIDTELNKPKKMKNPANFFALLFGLETVPQKKVFRQDLTNPKAYLDYRYFDQQQWYSQSACKAKARFFNNQLFISILSVSIPIVVLLIPWLGKLIFNKEFGTATNILTAIMSAIIAILSSKDKLYQNMEDWLRNRDISERLKIEYSLFQGRSGDYNIENDSNGVLAEKKFRENVENIIREAKNRFMQLRNTGEKNNKP